MTDHTILLWLNSQIAHSPELFYQALLFSNRIPWILMSLALCWMWFAGSPGLLPRKSGGILNIQARHLALMCIITMPFLFILSQGLQYIIMKPRPLHADIGLLIPIPPQIWGEIIASFPPFGAFPSDHAVVMGLLLGCVWRLNRWLGGIALCLVLFFTTLRIMLGFHWLTDIIAGLLLGLLAACVIIFTMPYYLPFSQRLNVYFQRMPAISHTLLFLFFYDFSQKFSLLFFLVDTLQKGFFA